MSYGFRRWAVKRLVILLYPPVCAASFLILLGFDVYDRAARIAASVRRRA